MLCIAVGALVLAGCPSGRPAPEPAVPAAASAGLPVADRPFLVDPLSGYPLVPAPDPARAVAESYRSLARSGDPVKARATAEAILERDPAFHPASVLAAQVDFLSGDLRAALDRLEPVAGELPSYTAAQLLAGRAAEGLDRVPRAYRAYRAVSDVSSIAADRADVLRPRAVEIVSNRLRDALSRGRVEEAAEDLERLRSWAPEADVTLRARMEVAAARDDREAELAALKELTDRRPERTDLALRRAELELAVGDATEGLRIVRSLAAEHPGDRRVQEALERAKFRWRLTLLPRDVQEIAGRPELTRGEVAVLVHWLVPQVRSTRRGAGRIAADILEHPFREEIARVVNLDLMEVDPTLHTFSPERPVRRGETLETLLRALDTFGDGVACRQAAPLGRRPTRETVCTAAARCGIIPEPGDCLPASTLSGAEALDLIRRTVELLSPQPANTP